MEHAGGRGVPDSLIPSPSAFHLHDFPHLGHEQRHCLVCLPRYALELATRWLSDKLFSGFASVSQNSAMSFSCCHY